MCIEYWNYLYLSHFFDSDFYFDLYLLSFSLVLMYSYTSLLFLYPVSYYVTSVFASDTSVMYLNCILTDSVLYSDFRYIWIVFWRILYCILILLNCILIFWYSPCPVIIECTGCIKMYYDTAFSSPFALELIMKYAVNGGNVFLKEKQENTRVTSQQDYVYLP